MESTPTRVFVPCSDAPKHIPVKGCGVYLVPHDKTEFIAVFSNGETETL